MKIPGFKCRCAPRLNMFHRCRDLAPKIQAPSPLPANSVCTAYAGFQSVILEPRDFDLDIACGGGIEEALEAAMALGPTSRALQDQGPGNECRGCHVDPPRVATLSALTGGMSISMENSRLQEAAPTSKM
jgi:hypothetical protein